MDDAGFDKQRLDELRSRFELQGLSIAQLPETIEHLLIDASQQLADSLLNEKKVVILGQGDGKVAADIMAEELIDSSSMERPPLPVFGLNVESGIESIQRQIQTIGQAGDVLIIIQSSRYKNSQASNDELFHLCSLAQGQGIKSIILGTHEPSNINLVDSIQIPLNFESRMNYLASISICSLTLIALVDYHLFGQPL